MKKNILWFSVFLFVGTIVACSSEKKESKTPPKAILSSDSTIVKTDTLEKLIVQIEISQHEFENSPHNTIDDSKSFKKLIKTIDNIELKTNTNFEFEGTNSNSIFLWIVLFLCLAAIVVIVVKNVKGKVIYTVTLLTISVPVTLKVLDVDMQNNSIIQINRYENSKQIGFASLVSTFEVNDSTSHHTNNLDSVCLMLSVEYIKSESEPLGIAIIGNEDNSRKRQTMNYTERLRGHLLSNYFVNFRERDIIISQKEMKNNDINISLEQMDISKNEIFIFFLH